MTTPRYVKWLRGLVGPVGKGVVNNVDARAIGRVADRLEELHANQEAII